MDKLLPRMSSHGDPSCSFCKTTRKEYETRSKANKCQQKNKGYKRTREGVVNMKGYRSEDSTSDDDVQGTNKTMHIELEGTSIEQQDVGSEVMEENEHFQSCNILGSCQVTENIAVLAGNKDKDRSDFSRNESGAHDEDLQDEDLQDGSRMDSHATSTRVEGSSEDKQVEEQETTSPTDEGENVSFNALKENYKLPHGFKSLSQLTPNYKLECIFGVVTEFQPPLQSKGSDLVMKMFIMDPTYHKAAREVLLFFPNKWKFPEVYCVGDIVRFHRIKASCYCGNMQLISNFATSCMVFPGMGDDKVTLEMARYQSDKLSFSDDDIRVVEQLRKWVKLNSHVIQPNLLVKIEDIQDKSFHSVVGNVVLAKRCQHQDYPWSITIYDGTRPQHGSNQDDGISHQLDNVTNQPDHTTVPEPDHRILWDISKNLAKEKLVTVHLDSKHAKTLWDLKMKAGNVLLFHNIWAEFDEHAHLNLFMSNDRQQQSAITFVNPHSALGREYEFK